MKKKIVLFSFILAFSLSVYNLIAQNSQLVTVYYDSSGAIFPNPERGFSAYRSTPLSLADLRDLRNEAVTVVQRIYTIPQFVNDTLSASFLQLVESDFQKAREGGVKLVLRFSYTDNINGVDAPLDTILRHIGQLEPLLQENYDVIAYMEAGFIGAWGEWYYSSNGLNNTQDRRTVLFRLLDALPVERMVSVRTPDYKRKIFNNNQPLTPQEAFNGTRRARTGAHNDCFLASETDFGTYLDNNIEGDKNFLNLDNRYVPQGGETCNPSPYSGCTNALIDLKRMRWSVINKDYHPAVLQGWVNQGCMDEIKRRLGYRFRLLEATLQDSVKPNGIFQMQISIVNDGWASPYNPRNLEIMLRNEQNGNLYYLLTNEDPRFWMAGDTVQVTVEGGIPGEIPLGSYEVLLNFSDPTPTLHNRPEYSIRLANLNVWEDSTGFNSLLHSIVIDPAAGGDVYIGNDYFQPIGGVTPIKKSELYFPKQFKLKGNYPNPFNGKTIIEFDLYSYNQVRIIIFNTSGQRVVTLLEEELQPGNYKIPWQPEKLSSGIYFYRITVNENSQTRPMIYVK